MSTGLIVDLFCGAGGTAEGARRALGRGPDISVNHDENAIAVHKANHPETAHVCGDVFSVRPRRVVPEGANVCLVTASPDCRHFSRAKGSPKVSPRVRTLARSLIPWAEQVRPKLMIVENVWEFTTWGPLKREDGPDGPFWTPNPAKAGQYFRKFVREIEQAGYTVDWKQLNAADFGAPTTRKRFFLVARRDGERVQWPEPTHGPGRTKPWRTAAECIDWSIPMQSIFDRKKDLAEATQQRIAHGFVKYVLGIGAQPNQQIGAWVERMHSTSRGERLDAPLGAMTAQSNHHALCLAIDQQGSRSQPIHPAEEPLGTVTTKNRHALVDVQHDPAWIAKNYTGVIGQQLEMPLGTITAKDHHSLCVAQTEKSWMIQTGYGERPGQAPRVLDMHQPLGTVVASGAKHGLCTAESETRPYIVNLTHGGRLESADEPFRTITGAHRGEKALCAASAGDAAEKRSRVVHWVERYYSHGGHSADLELPLPTIRTRGAMALIEARIEELQVVDILFRMFQPRELARAMGFEDSYIFTGTKEQQIARIGNAVCPQVPEAIIRANMDAINPMQEAA